MDLLHIHLKELLETIAHLHQYQQLQYAQQLQSIKQQQQQKQEQCMTTTSVANNVGTAASIGANLPNGLLASSVPTTTTVINTNNIAQQQQQTILSNSTQQQNHDSQLIFKLQELICTLIQVNKRLSIKTDCYSMNNGESIICFLVHYRK